MQRTSTILTLLLGLASPAEAQEWTQFRGKAGQGITEAPELPATFTERNILWRVASGGTGHSSPVLWGTRLFLTRIGKRDNSRDVVCFDAKTGKELWAFACSFDPYRQHRFNSFASSTPAVDAQGIYVLWSSGGKLYSLAVNHRGKKLWRRELGLFRAQHGSGASPILHGKHVIVANQNEGDESFLMALDKKTGKTAWRIERRSTDRTASYCCPVVYQQTDQKPLILFASQPYGLTAVDPATGKVRWEFDVEFKLRCVATPCLIKDKVFFSSGSGGAGKESVFVALPTGENTQPSVHGRMRRAIPYVPCALALDNRVFTFSDGGVASCLDGEDGSVLWRERLEGSFFSSPVSNGRVVYIPTKTGTLHSIGSGEKYEALGSFDLGGPTYSTPAIADNTMYARTSSELIALGPVPEVGGEAKKR
ncbi:MAG: PQQ-binding-like beta-propeller repeat protein [Planctomycetota bacterium]|nr:PQQ-binding-like beta-propeller repeat protein [Planctomycetota bacterium]